MSGGGGKPEKPSDNAQVRNLAAIAAEKWNMAQQVLRPVQDTFIDEARNFNNDANREFIQGRVNLGQQSAASAGLDSFSDQLSDAGIDLSSSKGLSMLDDAVIQAAEGGATTATRANEELDNQQAAGLQFAFDAGSGQEGRAISGMGTIAALSGNEARQEAQNRFNRNSANLQTLGAIAGGAARYGMSRAPANGVFDYDNMTMRPDNIDPLSDGASAVSNDFGLRYT